VAPPDAAPGHTAERHVCPAPDSTTRGRSWVHLSFLDVVWSRQRRRPLALQDFVYQLADLPLRLAPGVPAIRREMPARGVVSEVDIAA